MGTDDETAHAWACILERLKQLYADGYTQQEIGDLIGVRKATVSRWLSKEIGGERNTFGDIMRYAKRLNIPPNNLIAEELFTKPFAPSTLPPPQKHSKSKTKDGFKQISFDAPDWMIEQLSQKAGQLGINRQALIKMWLADKLSIPEVH